MSQQDVRAEDSANLVDSTETVYDVIGTRDGKWVRYRRATSYLDDVTADAQMKAWANESVKWFIVKRTTTVHEELIEVTPQ